MVELLNADAMRRCNVADCAPRPAAAPRAAPREAQAIDYLAKDYDSFLRAMLDQLRSRVPGWRDRSEADLGMAILELFAYAGDQLSYYQDRVANEAYLRTAVQYESVRRLLRLVDYEMDPGAAARVRLNATVAASTFLPAGFMLSTSPLDPNADQVIFETEEARILHPQLNGVLLAVAAPSNVAGTEIVLAAELDESFIPSGSWLLVAAPTGREWVRTAAVPVVNTVLHTTTLTLAAPLGSTYADLANTTVRGNALSATHGRSRTQTSTGTGLAAQSVALDFAPLTYVSDAGGTSRSTLQVLVREDPARPPVVWQEVEDFIESGPASRTYRTTRANDGFVTVRFGDGRQGRVPPALPAIPENVVVRYRTGIGDAGLVAADTLTHFDVSIDPNVLSITNPLPSSDAREPEGIGEAKLRGPRQIRVLDRAVIPSDYEELLLRGVTSGGGLLRPLHARARFNFTGSWTTVVVSVDMPGHAPLSAADRIVLEDALVDRKLAGYDVQVNTARYAPLHIGLLVRVRPGAFARDVRQAVEDALAGTARVPDATPFFGASRFGFGDPVHLSDLYSVVMAVEGVESLTVIHFKRLGDRYPDRARDGVIEVDPLEIVRCDMDPAHPENGVLYVRTCGGTEG